MNAFEFETGDKSRDIRIFDLEISVALGPKRSSLELNPHPLEIHMDVSISNSQDFIAYITTQW